MKKLLIGTLLLLMVFATVGCGGEVEETAYPEVNTQEGIQFALLEDTLKSTKATFLLTNETDGDVEYGIYEFHVEEKKDGVWQELTGTKASSWGTDTATLAAKSSVELPIDWKTLCGSLTKEEYRMIILVDGLPVAVEFSGK